MNDTAKLAPIPGDIVALTADLDALPAGVDEGEISAYVVDHVAAEMTPPADGFHLVRWSRSSLGWTDEAEMTVLASPSRGFLLPRRV